MFKKIAISLLLVLVAIIGLLQIDDELHPEAALWVEQIKANGDSQAYYYLMGIFAKSDENPSDVGLQRYQAIRVSQEKSDANKTIVSFKDYPDEKKLPIPTGEKFCKYWEAGCLENLLKNDADIPALLLNNAVLFERYQKFMQFDEFRTLSKPTLSEPISPFQYLTAGHRLESLMILDKAQKGEQQVAIKDLSNKIILLRNKIKLQDTFVGKMVFLHMLSESIDIMSTLSNRYDIPISESLTALTKVERDFLLPVQREFYMGYDMYQKLDRNPEFLEQGGNIPGWIVRILFKPNISSNYSFSVMSDIVNKSQMEQKEFSEFMTARTIDDEVGYSLRNYTGDVLNKVAKPNFMEYIARFHDVNCKIVLFNNMSLINEDKLEEIKNPYGLNDKPVFSKDGKKICFDGPFEDDRNFRCLMLKI